MKKILFIEGDGIGPELLSHARRVVDSIAKVEWVKGEAGLATFQKTGTSLPKQTLQLQKKFSLITLKLLHLWKRD